MYLIILSMIFTVFIYLSAYEKGIHPIKNKNNYDGFLISLLAGGFILRLILANIYPGHETDMTCFTAWADRIYKSGIPEFYSSSEFSDYPPGYMYILWVIGLIKNIFGISGNALNALVKMPAIIADLLIANLIYSYSKKHSDGNAIYLALFFIINPSVILNSSLWGQVDSVMTLFVVMTIIFLTEKKYIQSYFSYAAAIFLKPQAFMFAPIMIWFFHEEVFSDYNYKKLLKHLMYIFSAILAVIVLSIPFGLDKVVTQYIDTLSSYKYATVNAFNFWGMLGMNWEPLSPFVSLVGTISLVLITLLSFYILHKNKKMDKYFLAAAFLSFFTYMFSTKMHERYAFPSMILLLMAFALSLNLRHYILYVLVTLSQLFNTAYVLFIYDSDPSKYFKSPVIVVASIINLIIACYFAYVVFFDKKKIETNNSGKKSQKKKDITEKNIKIERSSGNVKIRKKDIIIVSAITIFYSLFAFTALGDKTAPENKYILSSPINIEYSEPQNISNLKFYLGSRHLHKDNVMTLKLYNSSGEKLNEITKNSGAVFFWSDIYIGTNDVSLIELSSTSPIEIIEMAFYDDTQALIIPSNFKNHKELFDEQIMIPEKQTYMNSAYFDEIYHARTAYEYINELDVYEWTHPPLGKVLISIGVNMFGMTPFGWRCAGVFFGILMIPVIYFMGKLFFKNKWLSAIIAFIFAFDFMHYTQTRIATIDGYVTFFIMLMYFFMFIYAKESFYDTSLRKTFIPLGLSGVFMGLAIATKWTGIYAAVGLAIIFFMTLYKRYAEYSYVKLSPNRCTNGIMHQDIISKFKKNTTLTILFCILFFIIIPIIIYILSYIPYLKANDEGFMGIIKNQYDIFTYHSKTVTNSTHSFSSKWWSWPIMLRPIWYYSNTFAANMKAGISAFGNPLVWWIGIIASIYCIYVAIKKKDKIAIMLVIAYLSNYLPWIFVGRTTYIYHYFPSVPFIALMIGYSVYEKFINKKWIKKGMLLYALCVFLLFIAFYPVLTGIPVNVDYVNDYLKWMNGWVLI